MSFGGVNWVFSEVCDESFGGLWLGFLECMIVLQATYNECFANAR